MLFLLFYYLVEPVSGVRTDPDHRVKFYCFPLCVSVWTVRNQQVKPTLYLHQPKIVFRISFTVVSY